MRNSLDSLFPGRRPCLMTHLVAGFPDLDTSAALLLAMAENGADLIEVQIPFSEPLGDGPTILAACHRALQRGIRPHDCLELVARLQPRISRPLLLMTYANIPWRMGMDAFLAAAAAAGACGLIIPDLPFDEDDGGYLERSRSHGLHPIQVLSAGMEARRRRLALAQASGFVYLTLSVGVTGARDCVAAEGLALIDEVRKESALPLAAGFGISSPAQVRQVGEHADIVIVGSHLLSLLERGGIPAVSEFLGSCRWALDRE